MQNITAHASSHVEKFLVANKLDMEANRRVSLERISNLAVITEADYVYQVPTQRGVELAAEYGIPFIEVSAKADVGIGAAFDTVARALLARKAQRHADERERERERATVDLPVGNGVGVCACVSFFYRVSLSIFDLLCLVCACVSLFSSRNDLLSVRVCVYVSFLLAVSLCCLRLCAMLVVID